MVLSQVIHSTVESIEVLYVARVLLARMRLKVYDEIYKVDHYENVGHKGEERTQLCLICATTLVVHAKLMPVDVLFYNSTDD